MQVHDRQTSGPSDMYGDGHSCTLIDENHTVRTDSDASQRSDKRHFVVPGCGPCPPRQESLRLQMGLKSSFFLALKGDNGTQDNCLCCLLTVQRGEPSFPPLLSYPWVPSVGQRHLDACHVYLIVRKQALVARELFFFCFVFDLTSLCFVVLRLSSSRWLAMPLKDTHRGISAMFPFPSYSHPLETSCLRWFRSFVLFESPYLYYKDTTSRAIKSSQMFSVGLEPWEALLFIQEDTGLRMVMRLGEATQLGKEGWGPKCKGRGYPIQISTLLMADHRTDSMKWTPVMENSNEGKGGPEARDGC